MTSQKRILKASNGVALEEVSLLGPTGPLGLAYVVTSQRTPEDFRFDSLQAAEKYYESEVKRCRGS